MIPPEASEAGTFAKAGMPPAVFVCPQVLTKRADFLKVARARHQAMPGFILQARRRSADESPDGIRIGYTCSRKVGNAVARNRTKRRLREIARLILPRQGHPGWDYVLIGRAGVTATRAFDQMQSDLTHALRKVHEDAR